MNNINLSNATVTDLLKSLSISVVNYERNKDYLEGIPYKRILDLAVILRWDINTDQFLREPEYIDISDDIIDGWGTDFDTIFDFAICNVKHMYDIVFSPISDYIFDFSGPDKGMYVLSNSILTNGAVLLCYKEVLRYIYDTIESDYYIIPSSVNELIILEENDECSVNYLREIVSFVNKNLLSDEEYLSDNIYFYEGLYNNLKIV